MFDYGICASFRVFFWVKNMGIAAEQRITIQYCVCRGKMAIETLSELKEAYGDECLTNQQLLK